MKSNPQCLDVMIVDDEPAARWTLREFCTPESGLRVIGEYADGASALEAIQTTPPHLVFLDIQIGKENGVELARSLGLEHLPIIVFVTAYDRYAIDAFSVCAADYLLKPFDHARFAETLLRIRRRWEMESAASRHHQLSDVLAQLQTFTRSDSDGRQRLLAESGDHMRLVDAAEVQLLEAEGNYVRLTLGRDVFRTRSTLQQAEKALHGQELLRLSRASLVNLRHVREISRTSRGDYVFVLASGHTVTSSEGYRAAVRKFLAKFKVGSL